MNGWKKIEGMQFSVNVVGDTIFLLTDDINLNMIIESTGSWVAICRAILDGTKYEVVKKETAQQPSDISLLTARVEALEAKLNETDLPDGLFRVVGTAKSHCWQPVSSALEVEQLKGKEHGEKS